MSYAIPCVLHGNFTEILEIIKEVVEIWNALVTFSTLISFHHHGYHVSLGATIIQVGLTLQCHPSIVRCTTLLGVTLYFENVWVFFLDMSWYL